MPHISKADVFNQCRVDIAPFPHFIEERERDVFETAVLQPTLPRLRQGGSEGESNDDIVGILGGAVASGFVRPM